MNILMVLDEEFPPDVRVEKEITVLKDNGHNVHLLCYDRRGLPQHEKINGYEIFRVPVSGTMYKFKALALLFPFYFRFWKKQILRQLDRGNYDLVHFHDLTLAKTCLEAVKLKGLEVIGDYHENRPVIMQYYHHVRTFPGNILISVNQWEKYQAKYTPRLGHLILVTQEARDYYLGKYSMKPDQITVVENYPDLAELRQFDTDEAIVNKYKDRKMLLYFGDTGLRRGTETILEAAELLRDKAGYCFVVIGTSREQGHLLRFKEERNLNNVEFTGVLPLGDAVSYFRAAYAGLSPLLKNIHHDTTYANKLFQYMAFGMPVLVSNCTAQEKVVKETGCGLVHEAGNALDLVEKIRMLDDPGQYERMGRLAAEAVENNYNFTVAGQRLLDLYDRIAHEIQ